MQADVDEGELTDAALETGMGPLVNSFGTRLGVCQVLFCDERVAFRLCSPDRGEFQQIAARRAGVTTYSSTSSFSGTTGRFGEVNPVRIEGESTIHGSSFSEGAAMTAQRQAALNTAATTGAIHAQTRADLARVATVFQRNTIDPDDRYLGAVIIEPPGKTACMVVVKKATETMSEITRAGPCRLRVSVNIDGEDHSFEFA
jgi:hypothetical protein